MELNITTLKMLRTKLNEHLADLGMEGVSFNVGNCSYSGGNATFKLEVTVDGAESREMAALKQVADMYGIDMERTHPVYTLVGYASKSRKYPFLVKKMYHDGTYKIGEDMALAMFGKVEQADENI